MMKASATGTGLNSSALIALANTRPSRAAGRKATIRLRTNFCWRRSVNMPDSTRAMRSRYSHITARIAPAWIAISNTLTFSPVKSSRLPARIRWPVEEIGRNSVKPSTRPMMIALMARRMSMNCFICERWGVQGGTLRGVEAYHEQGLYR